MLTGDVRLGDFVSGRRSQRQLVDDFTQRPVDVGQLFDQGWVALELAMRARLVEAIDWLVATYAAHAALVVMGDNVRLRLTKSVNKL